MITSILIFQYSPFSKAEGNKFGINAQQFVGEYCEVIEDDYFQVIPSGALEVCQKIIMLLHIKYNLKML